MRVLVERLQTEVLDPLEVAAVVGHERQIMLERGCSDQEIEVADQHTGRAEATPVRSEELAGILIHPEERDRFQEITQSPLAFLGIAGVVTPS